MRFMIVAAASAALVLAACSKEQKTRKPPDRTPIADPTPVRHSDPKDIFTSDHPPPPIAGGTLYITRDHGTAVAADHDRDLVSMVDLETREVRVTFGFKPGAQPGRSTEDSHGRVHVVLRGAGQIATISSDVLVAQRDVCAGPRGIAFDAIHDRLIVACLSGQVMSLPPTGGGTAVELYRFEPDLRDVVVEGDTIWISRFRSAEVIQIAGGAAPIVHRLPVLPDRENASFRATSAWRMVAHPAGGVAIVHQRSRSSVLDTSSLVTASGPPAAWGAAPPDPSDPCSSNIVHGVVSRIDPTGVVEHGVTLTRAVLPVDLAFSPDGKRYVVAAPGNAKESGFQWIAYRSPFTGGEQSSSSDSGLPGFFQQVDGGFAGGSAGSCAEVVETTAVDAEIVAVAVDEYGYTIAQSREPPMLVMPDGDGIALPGESKRDTGHEMFHHNTGLAIACASCHPEGGDDGHVWRLNSPAPRRTQSLRGGVLATLPLHWEGDLPDFDAIISEVMVERMHAPVPSPEQAAAFAHWVDSIPAPPPLPIDNPSAVERGRAIFESSEVACASCHSGPTLTNNSTADVGTGGALQVPSLRGLYARAPFLHDGCAYELKDRFTRCDSNDKHGKTSQLTEQEVADLVAYLETL